MGGQITLLGILTPNAPIPEEFVPSVLFGAKTGRLIFPNSLVIHA
jgi:hypothetical protein